MPTVNYFKSDAKNKFQSYSTQRSSTYTDSQMNFQLAGQFDYEIPFSSNVNVIGGRNMVDLNEINTIQISVDNTKQNQALKMEMKYGFYNDQANAHTKYTTEVPAAEFSYFTFPPKGNFVSAKIENEGLTESSNACANVFVGFSKYTQYNTHGQSSDALNQYQMVQFGRECNDYVDDIVLNRFDDRSIQNQHGHRSTWTNTGNAVVWGADAEFPVENFLDEYFQQIHVSSSSTTDNQKVILQGTRSLLSVRNTGFSEEITLAGTSNVQTTTDFRAVNKAFMNNTTLNNTGTISIRGALDGKLYNVIPPNAGESSASFFAQQSNRQSVVKEWQLHGDIGGSGAGIVDLELRVIDGKNDRRLKKISYAYESSIDIKIDINILLTTGQVVYARVVNPQADTEISSNIVLRQYDTSV